MAMGQLHRSLMKCTKHDCTLHRHKRATDGILIEQFLHTYDEPDDNYVPLQCS